MAKVVGLDKTEPTWSRWWDWLWRYDLNKERTENQERTYAKWITKSGN